MRSPADMGTIQIELTNACVHRCSNCTRLCGHHKNPFFMSWETFERAVASLKGFEGIIGMMGGEPTLHPEFKRFAMHLRQQHGMTFNQKVSEKPLQDFKQYTREQHQSYRIILNKGKGPGLWTSITPKYYDYYELIQDTFVYQCLNDHMTESYHQPIMITRKELGISDQEWIKLRDNCWIQNTWSASITPKGAFFCEVAAALDMLFDGPGGWPIEPGWWKRKPEDFADQLHWCEMCGVALDTFKRNANEEVDDVSPAMYELLRSVDSPKLKMGAVEVYQPGTEVTREGYGNFRRGQYIADETQRIANRNTNLYLRAMEGVLYADAIAVSAVQRLVKHHAEMLEHIFLLTASEAQARKLQFMAEQDEKITIIHMEKANWGQLFNQALNSLQERDWILLLNEKTLLPNDFRQCLSRLLLNPGGLYKFAEAAFLNRQAANLVHIGFDGVAQCTSYEKLEIKWDKDKIIRLMDLTNDDQAEETGWKETLQASFLKETDFRKRFETVMLQSIPEKGPVLITQSASHFLTRGLIELLQATGFEAHVVTHARFARFFTGCVPSEQIHAFDQTDYIQLSKLQEFCDGLKQRVSFHGAVIPYSTMVKSLAFADGYQPVEEVARYLAGKVVARVNLKREFMIRT